MWSPHEDSFNTNSFISVPDLTPLARILGGPSTHDCRVPLNPATKAHDADNSASHKPWPQSGSASVSGSMTDQTKTDIPTKIPEPEESKLGSLEECPIIARTWNTVATSSDIDPTTSMIVATNPALWLSA